MSASAVPSPLCIATRASDLAVAQARWVGARLERALGVRTELVPLKTSGDRLRDVSLAKLGGKGLFVKEIEEALRDERAHLAVHSAKDLPAEAPADLAFVAFPQRADPRDALVTREPGATLATLPKGARVGTGSVRRRAQLLRARSDLHVVGLRGNVPTRLAKLERESLDAVVLACAGLDRLGLGERVAERLDPETLLPAVCQGTLAVQTRAGGALARELARALDDPDVGVCAAAERGFLAGVGGDCTTPLAALAEHAGAGRLRLRARLLDPEGERSVGGEVACAAEREAARAAGEGLAAQLLDRGGRALLEAAAREERA